MLENLQKYNILLASKSPRRRELMNQLRVPYKVVTLRNIDESYPDDMAAGDVAQYLSGKKADAYREIIGDDELLITADTTVVLGDKVYGKPENRDDALRMLHELSGKVHQVVSGVTIATKYKRTSFTAITDVKFADIDADDILYYVDNYLPLDKAGAYGIQEWIGCVAVEWIKGSYYNVMGLPVHRLYRELKLF
ncbi:MAG: Maf family nucleotide pyrophosphatase [Muribaculaceae bacterium]|nr:Maf family nucleotide pyrophosphatase [Muribaculaceae bacterium]